MHGTEVHVIETNGSDIFRVAMSVLQSVEALYSGHLGSCKSVLISRVSSFQGYIRRACVGLIKVSSLEGRPRVPL